MKISEYIEALQAIQRESGDLEVEAFCPYGSRVTARPPGIKNKLILKGREWKPRFWSYEEEDRKGEPVCCV